MIVRMLRWRLAPLLVPLAIVGASAAAVAFGVVRQVQAERVHGDLTRFDHGESTAITVSEPGQHLVWVRHDDYAAPSPELLTVTVRREGAAVATRGLPGDVTYQETNTAITALWAFDADQTGIYTVTGSDINRSATFLTGTEDPQAHVEQGDRWIKLGILGIAVGMVGVLAIRAILGRRSRRPPAASDGIAAPVQQAIPERQ